MTRRLVATLALVLCPGRFVSGSPGDATSAIPAPVIPSHTFRVTEFGAVADGKTLSTKAIEKAIAACTAAGGGRVLFPAGRYLTGPFSLSSSMELRLEKGATLLITDDPAEFTLKANRYQDCISARDCHDIAITGDGVIDGQGGRWWAEFIKSQHATPGSPPAPHRPFLVVLTHCTRVLVSGVTIRNSPMFHLVPQQCRDVRITGVHIYAPEQAKNTDGIDPSGWNFLITHCTFDVGDDCIALKPSARIDPALPACRDFLITNCTFQRGHGMSIGGQTPGGLDRMIVRDCTFHGTDAGIRLKASRGAGGLVENVTYERLWMTGVKVPIQITSYYRNNSPGDTPVDPARDTARPVDAKTPIWRNITIRNIAAGGAVTAGQIFGLPEMPVTGITLTGVNIAGRKGMRIVHARGIHFANSSVTAENGPPVTAEDSVVTGIDSVSL